MIKPAMASPLTNFMAPSMAPNNWLSRDNCSRLSRACTPSIRPARKSLSMDICLPGIASRLKRAATSATRSEPLVITRKLTRVRIRKISIPTARLPPTTKLPKASTMSPASCSSRIRRVVAIDSARRNIVVSSRIDGNDENAKGPGRYSASTINKQEIQILSAIRMSTSQVGNGTIKMNTMAMTTTAPRTSARCATLSSTALMVFSALTPTSPHSRSVRARAQSWPVHPSPRQSRSRSPGVRDCLAITPGVTVGQRGKGR